VGLCLRMRADHASASGTATMWPRASRTPSSPLSTGLQRLFCGVCIRVPLTRLNRNFTARNDGNVIQPFILKPLLCVILSTGRHSLFCGFA
jgi:hypothetical protein